MRGALLCVVVMAAVMPSTAGAQSLMLSEAEAISRLSSDSPRVRAIRAGIDVGRVDVLSAERWPNPRFTLDRESVAGITEYLTMVSQPLPITGKRGLDADAARAQVSAITSRADDDVRRLRADLRLAFATLVAAQDRVRELTAARDRLQELAGVLAKREAAGDAAGFDRLRAEREELDLEADLDLTQIERANAQARLAGFFGGITDASQIVAVGGAPQHAPVPEFEPLVAQASSTRGELVALQHEIEAAGFAARAADRRIVPEPEIVAGTKSSTAGTGDIGSVFTVHASIPLFDHSRPEHALATARAAQAGARADAFRVVLRAEVASWRQAVIQRRQSAERYRTAAVSGASEVEQIARVSYDAGERGILELLDAYRLGSSARIRQTNLDLGVRQAEIELEFATGWEASK